jgi:hypothetical protein
MFCDGCGSAVQPGQGFCNTCGKQIIGTVTPMQARRTRVQEHVKLIGILWLAISAFNALGGIAAIIVANTLFMRSNMPSFLHPLISVVGILICAKAALGFLAGWGLLEREQWARTLSLVLAFISLFNIPFGTAVGVYTMWVLLPNESEEEYDSLVASRVAA